MRSTSPTPSARSAASSAHRGVVRFHARRHPRRDSRRRPGRGAAARPAISRACEGDGKHRRGGEMAGAVRRRGVRHHGALSLRAEPHRGEVALDHLGQHFRGGAVDRRVAAVLLVCGALRQLQQDLRLARRSDRLHDVGPDAGFPKNGNKAGEHDRDRHELWPEPMYGALDDGGFQIGFGQGSAQCKAAL